MREEKKEYLMTFTSPWPNTAAEKAAFKNWQHEVANGDTPSGFRDWLHRRDESDLEEDRERLFGEYAGRFRDGYDDEAVNRLNDSLLSVEVACVWEYADELGFGGDSEIAIRSRTDEHSEWYALSDALWATLAEPTEVTDGIDWTTAPLWDPNSVPLDLADLLYVSGANYARANRVPQNFQNGGPL